jgi:hypothetical protein
MSKAKKATKTRTITSPLMTEYPGESQLTCFDTGNFESRVTKTLQNPAEIYSRITVIFIQFTS